MKSCKKCKRCDPYIEWDIIEYDPAYGWCEVKKKDVGVIVWECLLWIPKLILLTLILLCGCCVEITAKKTLIDGTVYEARYFRWGNQEIGEFTLDPVTGQITLKSQKSNAEGIARGIAEGLAEGLK